MSDGKIIPIILCGGSGTRLWPLSRENHPKQFVDLGNGRTLFKDTLSRIKNLPNLGEIIAICNEIHRFFVLREMEELGVNGKIILEPAPRNTAPAIAIAANLLVSDRDTTMLVLPADHFMENTGVLSEKIFQALPLANSGHIVTFGITPDSPATAYGYIKKGRPINQGFTIERFIEKPDLSQAEKMLETGDYYWNSGIFLMKPDVFLSELKNFAPQISAYSSEAVIRASRDTQFIRPHEETFLSCPEDSIDYAIMEKTEKGVIVPLPLKWSDLGSWEAFFQQAEKDEANNAIQGDVLVQDSSNCYLHSNGRLLAAVGVSNLMVVETKDAVVVASRKEGQRIKDIVASLKKSGRYQYKSHPLVYKPWGSYEILAQGDRFQVKRLIINPGDSLSLQYHHHRTEHWIIVSGTALIELDNKKTLYTENQSIFIPIGCQHKLENPGKIPLILIEVQSGSYLEENDIVRMQDQYGRK